MVKKYPYDIENWITYVLISGMLICMIAGFFYIMADAYYKNILHFCILPLIAPLTMTAVFVYHTLKSPYSIEIDIEDKLLRCTSIVEVSEVSVYAIKRINLPPSYLKVQIGSIISDNGKVYINALFKDIDGLIAELHKLNAAISITHNWIS